MFLFRLSSRCPCSSVGALMLWLLLCVFGFLCLGWSRKALGLAACVTSRVGEVPLFFGPCPSLLVGNPLGHSGSVTVSHTAALWPHRHLSERPLNGGSPHSGWMQMFFLLMDLFAIAVSVGVLTLFPGLSLVHGYCFVLHPAMTRMFCSRDPGRTLFL